MFVPGKLFQLSITFLDKAMGSTLMWSTLKMLHLGRLKPYTDYDGKEKRFCILRQFVNYGVKKFYDICLMVE